MITYFYRDTSSDLTGSPSEIGNFNLLRATGTSSSQINTGNMNSGATRSCWFFTEAADPGADGTSTGSFQLELRIDIQNADIGIRCYLQRYNSGGTAQGSIIEAAEGSQTAGAATRQFNWTNPSLGSWSAGDRLGVRVQFTNIGGSMNQSCRLAANLETDTLITPFTAAIDPEVITASPTGLAATAQIVVPAVGAVFDPADLDVTVVGTTAELTWTPSPTAGVIDYQVFRRTPQTGDPFDPETDTPVATGVTLASYNDEGLSIGEYDWQVFGRIGDLLYGVDESTVGPANEPATTIGTEATTSTITSVLSGASPGDVILLRAGTYSGNETVPSGSAGNPITVKPYDGETATITGDWTFNDYNILAGVFLNGGTSGWALSVDRNTSTVKHHLEFRYLELTGGGNENMRIARNVADVRVHHCYFRGGSAINHCYKSHWQTSSWAPTNIEIDHNVFSHVDGGAEDGLQLEGWGYHDIHHNNFRDIPVEDGLDIKEPHIAEEFVDVRNNHFDGDSINGTSLICHARAIGKPRIRWNCFSGDNSINLNGDVEDGAFVDFQRNIVPDQTSATRITLHWLTDSVFSHNFIGAGQIRMGEATNAKLVLNLLVEGNRFEGTNLNAEANCTVHTNSVNNELASVPDESEWTALGIGQGTADYPAATCALAGT